MWKNILEESIAFRRRIHQNPELTWQEYDTAAFIREILDKKNITWEACAETGTLGRLASHRTGPHIALRGDIDALPITEQTDVEWRSQNPGCMHACGHDGHTASLLATASWLKLHEDSLPGPVTLLFQPAEEGGHGAKKMIEAGALEGIDAVYGWHNWPAIPYGKAVCPDGPVMSANSVFSINVEGVGGHGSQPEKCKDPVLAGSAIVMAAQQIVARHLPPQISAVVSITSFDAKSASNVIPGKAVLSGGIRASDTGWRDKICERLSQVAEETAKSYQCTATVVHEPCYGATVNHKEASDNFKQVLQEEFGDQWQCDELPVPIMASEDFSYFLVEKPGAFALIGADDNEGHHHPCHSSHYDFNDKLIPHVVNLYSRLVGAPLID